MVNALVPHKSWLPKARRARRAAQYVRMSTDYRQYSITNQFAVIAAYAQRFELEMVRTYRDDAKSGLHIKNRKGLLDLIGDVQCGRADFGCILVFDISRWGRFQDVDESAYYEFLCKRKAALLPVPPTLFVPQADGVDASTESNQLELGHHDVVSRTQAGSFASHLFGACQVVAPLSFDGMRPSLLRFDFLPQLEHFVPNTAERYG